MRAVIFGNGHIKDYDKIKSYIYDGDFIICADGGYRHIKKLGMSCNIIIGDFDSVELDTVDTEVIKYPVKKDFTDGELCVKYALEHGYDELVLFGMVGDRLDHTINNLLMLSDCGGTVIDDNNEIYILKDKLEFTKKKGKTLSIIPVKGDLEGMYSSGLEYPLNNDTLEFGKCRGNSNVITEDYCKISTRNGIGLVIITDGR